MGSRIEDVLVNASFALRLVAIRSNIQSNPKAADVRNFHHYDIEEIDGSLILHWDHFHNLALFARWDGTTLKIRQQLTVEGRPAPTNIPFIYDGKRIPFDTKGEALLKGEDAHICWCLMTNIDPELRERIAPATRQTER